MNVLSCFDGMSCAQIALNRANIHYDNYYSSEIDKYCIKVTQHHYPDTIQLGDIVNWQNWNLPQIDLIVGGSPCQGFSTAGKELNFEDERSKLFFVFVNILKYFKPKFFLLENVKMKKEWENTISGFMNIKPIEINSALVSAQNRKRLYWTNISVNKLPKDKKIYLEDIIECGVVDRQKSYCIDANYYKGGSLKRYLEKSRRQNNLSPRQSEKRLMVGRLVNRRINEFGKRDDYNESLDLEPHIEINESRKSNNLSTVDNDNVLLELVATDNITRRKLTPIECERLQTIDDNYTLGDGSISNTQRYKMLGNGFTIDVIVHILKYLPKNLNDYEPYILADYKPQIVEQRSLF